jgi:hypothetical protein
MWHVFQGAFLWAANLYLRFIFSQKILHDTVFIAGRERLGRGRRLKILPTRARKRTRMISGKEKVRTLS